MAQKWSIRTDREQSKFVESPSRSNESAVEVVGQFEKSPFLPSSLTHLNLYSEVSSIAVSLETNIDTYTVPAGKRVSIDHVGVSGDNVAEYRLRLNGSVIEKRRTSVGGSPNEIFNMNGLELAAGDTIRVTVVNCSHDGLTGVFESKIKGIIGDS